MFTWSWRHICWCHNAQIQMCDDGMVKSDLSIVVLHYFGLGRTIGFQAAVSDTSGGKHLESSHQLIVRSKCLWHIVTQTRQVSGKYGAWCQVLVAPYPF